MWERLNHSRFQAITDVLVDYWWWFRAFTDNNFELTLILPA